MLQPRKQLDAWQISVEARQCQDSEMIGTNKLVEMESNLMDNLKFGVAHAWPSSHMDQGAVGVGSSAPLLGFARRSSFVIRASQR